MKCQALHTEEGDEVRIGAEIGIITIVGGGTIEMSAGRIVVARQTKASILRR